MRRLPAAIVSLTAAVLAACGGSDGTPAPSPSDPTGACSAGAPVAGTPPLTTTRVADGLASPLDLQAPPGDRARVFVVEQPGRIRVVRNGSLLAAPFLDISSQVRFGGEQGLLGLAFHPRYLENGRFFVNYTDVRGDTHIAEFRASPAADVADAGSERLVLFVAQPFGNHNAGGMAFGNDGFLYFGLGDGGSGGDPFGNGQDLGTLLGKMLRIDVDGGSPYAVPPDNPFVGRGGARGEIWAFGLRNPWRFSVDRANGDLYIGDVGQSRREEVDVGLASRRGGENYGWNVMEGFLCFDPATGCDQGGLTLPALDYSSGCSVIAGPVYRGCRMPGHHGTFFFGDYCEGFVRSFRLVNGEVADQRDWTDPLARGVGSLSAFGVDADGEMYILDLDGDVSKVVPAG
jgi:glucose/arabinose dehydrogenase